jgi:hypothetical protein
MDGVGSTKASSFIGLVEHAAGYGNTTFATSRVTQSMLFQFHKLPFVEF